MPNVDAFMWLVALHPQEVSADDRADKATASKKRKGEHSSAEAAEAVEAAKGVAHLHQLIREATDAEDFDKVATLAAQAKAAQAASAAKATCTDADIVERFEANQRALLLRVEQLLPSAQLRDGAWLRVRRGES